MLSEVGVPEACIYRNRRVQLPGWFRAEKQWDLIVKVKDELVAVLELKSQVGPSFGNNFNNRSEEAIGSATDVWVAYREERFGKTLRVLLADEADHEEWCHSLDACVAFRDRYGERV